MTRTTLSAPLYSRIYGRGTRGSSGRVPKIELRSVPQIGNAALRIGIHGAPGNTPVLLLLGQLHTEQSLQGVALVVDLQRPYVEFTAVTDPYGEAEVRIRVPDHPGLAGSQLAAQWFVRDAGASQLGFSASAGLQFDILGA